MGFCNKMLGFYLFSTILFSQTFSETQTNQKRCLLCNNGKIIEENHQTFYAKTTKETNILLQTKHFYVAIDNYPIGDCHILIVPKQHKLSFSTIDISEQYELETIIETLSDVAGTKDYTLYEHGSNGIEAQRDQLLSIYHAHLHFFLHLDIKCENVVRLYVDDRDAKGFLYKKLAKKTLLAHIKSLPTEKPYRFCYVNQKQASFCIPDHVVHQVGKVIRKTDESSIIRKLFAKRLQKSDNPFWNRKTKHAIDKGTKARNLMILNTIKVFRDRKNLKKMFVANFKKMEHGNYVT